MTLKEDAYALLHGLATWGLAGVFVVGAISELSYWHVFGIDIVPYLGLSDFLRFAVWPMVLVASRLFSIVLGIACGMAYIFWRVRANHKGDEKLDHAHAKKSAGAVLWIALPMFIGLMTFLWWNGAVDVADLVALLLGLGMGLALAHAHETILPAIKSELVGATLGFIIGATPALAVVVGRDAAYSTLTGTNYTEVRMSQEQAEKADLPMDADIRLLKHVNDYDFLLVSGKVVVVQADDLRSLIFVRQERASIGDIRVPFVEPRLRRQYRPALPELP